MLKNELASDEFYSADSLEYVQYLTQPTNEIIYPSEQHHARFTEFMKCEKHFKDKACNPQETLEHLIPTMKTFLNKTPFRLLRYPYMNAFSKTWSVFGKIYHKFTPFFQAEGKGTSIEAAMSSFFGELVERTQAGFFLSKNPYKRQIYPYWLPVDSPLVNAEQKLRNSDFTERWQKESVMPPLAPVGAVSETGYFNDWLIFQDLKSKKTAYFQRHLFLISNGLATGNTYEEAFVQGFCELLERYSAFKVLKERRKLPTIPHSRLTKIKDVIDKIERYGYRLHVKDASLDFDFPVAAVFFENLSRNGNGEEVPVWVNFGAASSLDVAVERCITESLQGLSNYQFRSQVYRTYISSIRQTYDTFPQIESFYSQDAFFLNSYARCNMFPTEDLEFLKESVGTPNYKDFASSNLLDEVEHILQRGEEYGFDFYLRDVNWLGVRTMRVFVPQIYTDHRHMRFYTNHKIEAFKVKLMRNFAEITRKDLEILKDPEFLTYLLYHFDMADFLGVPIIPLEKQSVWAFFGQLALAYGETELAEKYLAQCSLAFPMPGSIDQVKAIPRKELLKNLRTYLPDCSQECGACEHYAVCKTPLYLQVESMLLREHPDVFSEFNLKVLDN